MTALILEPLLGHPYHTTPTTDLQLEAGVGDPICLVSRIASSLINFVRLLCSDERETLLANL
jgi:hypothetical protein